MARAAETKKRGGRRGDCSSLPLDKPYPPQLDKIPQMVYLLGRAVQNKEGLTIAQAAKAMRLSPKTVRRRIKEGKIPYKLVPGKYGDEYRLTELPSNRINPEALDTTPTLALDIIHRLEQENRNLAGQLGAALERVRALENQVKLLTMGRQPWWRRLFNRMGKGQQ